MIPSADDLLATAVVVALPMRVRFRGITVREVLLSGVPAGWGRVLTVCRIRRRGGRTLARRGYRSPHGSDRPDSPWRSRGQCDGAGRSRVGGAGHPRPPPGARTAKVKVAEKGQALRDDVERVEAARALVEKVRVDANGAGRSTRRSPRSRRWGSWSTSSSRAQASRSWPRCGVGCRRPSPPTNRSARPRTHCALRPQMLPTSPSSRSRPGWDAPRTGTGRADPAAHCRVQCAGHRRRHQRRNRYGSHRRHSTTPAASAPGRSSSTM